MDSRERTFLALGRQEPDRVPIDFWSSRGLDRSLGLDTPQARQAFLDAYDVDLRYIEGPRYIGPPLRRWPDGTDEDIWGVVRRCQTVVVAHGREDYQEVYRSPLASAQSPEEVDAYPRWPTADWFDYADIARQCQAVRRQGRVAVFMGDRLNRIAQLKPAMYLRGVEQILLDMAWNPELAQAIIGRIRAFYLDYLERILEAAQGQLDILLTGDDFGAQNGPLISPGMWVRYLGDGFAQYSSLARQAGVRVAHHTCGAVRPIIPLMIERGLDVLQSLQPEAADMDPQTLKDGFGDRLAFHGGISIQRTLPLGTPQDVRREVQERIEILGRGGGYIACTAHNIQADTPAENVRTLLQAYHEFGRYAHLSPET